MDVAYEAEDAMAKFLGGGLRKPNLPLRDYLLIKNRLARNILKATGWQAPNLFMGCGHNLFLYLMWCDCRVYALMRNARIRKTIYIFDSWEPFWPEIEREMATWQNVGAVYFSSSQTARFLRNKVPFPVRWCPQATTISSDRPDDERALAGQPIVLNIGRPNKILSDFFVKFCADYGMQYISQDTVEGIIFPKRQDFLDTLKRSAIVIVHPRNIDAPDVTGCVSMLTARYFEAYHSGGVVCGFKPDSGEFEKVLNGFPFVEYRDPDDFRARLLDALAQKAIWLEARSRIQHEHSWETRARFISEERDFLEM